MIVKYVPLPFKIERGNNGKKQYIFGDKISTSPPPFGDWRQRAISIDLKDLQPILDSQHIAIIPDKSLVIIDCDTIETTIAVNNIVKDDTYIVDADTRCKHFYFYPTKYAKDSLLYSKPNRVKVGKIDVLKGNSLVFTASKGNATKTTNNSLSDIKPIPNELVDWLQSQMIQTNIVQSKSSYTSIITFMGPQLQKLLDAYKGSGKVEHIQEALSLVCPARYRPILEPKFDANDVPDGEGINFLQALISRLGVDPTISLELAIELITIIALKIWTDPLSTDRLQALLTSIPTQTYSNGEPVFVYDANVSSTGVLAAFENDGYYPIYRTSNDTYILANSNGNIMTTSSLNNLATTLASSNFSLLVNGKEIPPAQVSKVLKMSIEHIKTVQVVENPKEPFGYYVRDLIPYFNTYKQTRYMAIARGEHLETEEAIKIPPTINKILNNVFYDHLKTGPAREPSDLLLINFLQFISHKLKTLDYSPIVFQFLGKKGTGKDTLIDLVLGPMFGGVGERLSKASNNQFNEDYATKSIVKIDEAKATETLREELKKLSGATITRVEPKRQTAYYIENISTYFVTANKATLLKEDINDRRFVPILSFTAPMLSINNLQERIQIELEEFALYLRDLPTPPHYTYTSATGWQDSAIKMVEDAQDNNDNVPGKILRLLDKLRNGELDRHLLYEVGAINGVYVYREQLYIPLVTVQDVYFKETRDVVYTGLTKQIILEKGFGEGTDELSLHIMNDRNLNKYTKRIDKLRVSLTPLSEDYKEFQEILTNIKENIDILD